MATRTAEDWQALVEHMEKELQQLKGLNIENNMRTLDTRMTNMEVAMAAIGSSGVHGGGAEKSKFSKDVLESK